LVKSPRLISGAVPEAAVRQSIPQEDVMKKAVNKDLKLKLHRETLRHLEQPELAAVEGGVTASACLTSCNTCNTRNTCTTRFC
jgi:hypothetical protein